MRNRSFFFPFVLIATGLVWLLVEIRTIPAQNLWALMYIWPYFLMLAGIGLILRSRWPVVRVFISGLLVLGMVASIVFAPLLGWNKAPAWSTYHFNGIHLTGVDGSVKGSGVIVSEKRQVADFTSINIDFPTEVTVKQGSATALTIEGDDNIVAEVATRVSGNTLYIESRQPSWTWSFNPTRPVRIDITVKDLQGVDFPSAGTLRVEALKTEALRLSISGAGSVKLVDLDTRSLTSDMSGAGSVNASGKADSLRMDISGLGSFQGGSLESQDADATISGAGSATLWVKTSLIVNISGTGSIHYYGSPSVTRNVSGLGSINGLGNK
jgi:hypothetical protein